MDLFRMPRHAPQFYDWLEQRLGNQPLAKGRAYYVDVNEGFDSAHGQSWAKPLKTMSKAFSKLRSGDSIVFNGKIREQLATPVGIFDCTIIGAGNKPRHPDAHTGYNGSRVAAGWTVPASPAAATPTLKIQQQGWRLVNFLMYGAVAASPAVDLFRDGGAGDLERDASHAEMVDMRFDANPLGVRTNGGASFVRIRDSLFRGHTTTAVAHITGAGIATPLQWELDRVKFMDNVNHIVVPLAKSSILDSCFGNFTTMSIDLDGGVAGNVISRNALSGTYSIVGGYRGAGAGDEWGGNYNVLAGGVTAADPA